MCFTCIHIYLSSTTGEITQENPPSIADILMCITGCTEIPPLGFQETPTISFSFSCTPHFSTCAVEAVLPFSLPGKYDDFVERMCFFIQNSPDFRSA